MSRALDVANDLSTLGPKYDAGNFDAISVTNSVVDAGQLLGIDLSGLANAGDYISVNVTNAQDDEVLVFSSGALVNQALSSIDHDALTNFVANEHIDWTSASANFSTSGTLNTHTIPSGTGTLALVEDIPTDYITLTSLSFDTPATASGSGDVGYDNTTGVFTYTPPDLSSYLTTETTTSLTYSISTQILTYTDESGSTNNINLSGLAGGLAGGGSGLDGGRADSIYTTSQTIDAGSAVQ